MPKHDQITISLEGLPENNGEVRLGDLIHELQALNALLVGLDRTVSPEGRVSTDYRVTDLRRVNPSQIVVSGSPKDNAPDVRAQVFGQTFETLSLLEEGQKESGFDFGLLEDLRDMAEPVGKRLGSVALGWNGSHVRLSTQLRERIDKLLEPDIVSYGFLQGRLEAANIHHGANALKIYPRVGPLKIGGRFRAELSSVVGPALGRDVVVWGLMKYRSGNPYAYSIEVDSIEVFPDAPETPPIKFQGEFRDLTGELSSEEWLELRREESIGELMVLVGR